MCQHSRSGPRRLGTGHHHEWHFLGHEHQRYWSRLVAQAILDSNAATGGLNSIDFAMPGAGVQIIVPLSALPAIVNPLLIDGFTQPGFAGEPLIELSGVRPVWPAV